MCSGSEEADFHNLKQGQLTVSTYVYTFVKLSRYATDLVDTEAKKIKRFIIGLNQSAKQL